MTCGSGISIQLVYCSYHQTASDRRIKRVDDSLCDQATRPSENRKPCYSACDDNEGSLMSVLVLEMRPKNFTSNQTSSTYEHSLLLATGIVITNSFRSH